MPPNGLFRLSEPAILFYPPQKHPSTASELHQPTIVNAIVRAGPIGSLPSRTIIAQYYASQANVSAVIENIMLLDLLSPMSGVEVQGDGYLLLGDKIPWPEGKDLCAIWGDDEVTVAKHQWTFVFNPV
ncbi:hypothetical protein B0H12DRAFT_1239716 [Mycena haematopus]|nr:hypothetical protein B0H12DRAFT_1240167 [Mycena haematopus]KAJ7232142.1 hypothetical protein B0H12DRAFT_1239716 [Mycena haematopus]